MNESALFAAKRGGLFVEMADFEKAKEKIMMGPERKSMLMPEEERRNTAYHEAGHALVARLMPKCDPVHKVTIIPRGRALGVTMQLPEADRYSSDKIRMNSTLAVLFGGRIAEDGARFFVGISLRQSRSFQDREPPWDATVAVVGESGVCSHG